MLGLSEIVYAFSRVQLVYSNCCGPNKEINGSKCMQQMCGFMAGGWVRKRDGMTLVTKLLS